MATLVSPGVSVTVTDESFFIPASAPTVPLIFIATADEKTQPDGITPADGTFENDVVRTITSLSQSVQTYGTPTFLEDSGTGAQYHGDARNEYGLFALNQYLGIGNRAYVLRTNVNLNDNLDDIRSSWDSNFLQSQVILENLVNEFLAEWNVQNAPSVRTTVTPAELKTLAVTATEDIWTLFSFANSEASYFNDQSSAPFDIFANGYDQPATGTAATGYQGFDFEADAFTLGGGSVAGEYTPTEAGLLLLNQSDDYKFTVEFLNETSLGANDTARRAAIVTAFAASINSNTELRSENFDYNLILCPGYPELADEMITLAVDINEEALVIADTPMDRDPDGITNPSTGWAATTARQRSVNVAYYYPSALASNLDGTNVTVAASGVALRTITFSDNVSFLWFAPAGLRRGIISGVTSLGYVDGALGGPTTFVEVNLNNGQRDALYQYAASGDINPLVFFPGQGFVVWGQKVSTSAASALDRVNVNRMVKYVKRQLRRNTLSFVFEPNDQLTRDNLKGVVDNFLGDLIVKRGLFDFATVSDESNNTPDRIDRNEMYIDVALKPIKAAEFIYIPIRIVTTDAEI